MKYLNFAFKVLGFEFWSRSKMVPVVCASKYSYQLQIFQLRYPNSYGNNCIYFKYSGANLQSMAVLNKILCVHTNKSMTYACAGL